MEGTLLTANANAVINDICERVVRIERLYDLADKGLDLNQTFYDFPETELKKPQRPTSFDVSYVRYFAEHQMALFREDIVDIKKVISERLEKGINKSDIYVVYYFLYMIEIRLKMLVHEMHDRINIISLGRACLPRLMTAKWGIKKPRAFGERSFPFDLSVTPLTSVLQLLRSRFSGYLDDRFLAFDREKMHCVHTGLGISWNHERGEIWSDNNFSRLKDRYVKRIENFYKIFQEEKTSLFLLHTPFQSTEFPIDIACEILALHKKEARCRLSMLCLKTEHHSGHPSFISRKSEDKSDFNDLFLCDVPAPHPDYVWYKHEDFLLPAGLQFELRVVDAIVQALRIIEPDIPEI